MAKVNSLTLNPGDSVLFKRGDIWRGQLLPMSGNTMGRVYYGAYSIGELPLLLGSRSYNNTNDWINIGVNLWKCNTIFTTDVGNVIFDNASNVGIKKWSQIDLFNQNDFWFNLSTNELVMYSSVNPASMFLSIEFALRKDIVNQQNTSYVTYENMSLKYGGAHGFGGGNTDNITIKSCEISYIGGGDLNMNGVVRFGNGVEFWGNASNNIVEKCKIWEIYDTGVTNQNHTIPSVQQNIRYQNNLIWNCGLSSFEYWNRPASSSMSNIFFENNTCLNAGYGWGQQREDYHGIHILVDSNPAQTDTIYIRNNILHNAQRSIYVIEDNANGYIELDYNLVYQTAPTDTLFASFPSFSIYKYSEFNTFKSIINKDLNSIASNPNFQNLTIMDCSLASNSPAIDVGTTVELIDDILGNMRPSNSFFDIGAYEFQLHSSVDEIDDFSKFQLYPNPTKNIFFIKTNSKFTEIDELIILNTAGKRVKHITDFNSKTYVDVSSLEKGIYFVQLIMNNEVIEVNKIIK